MIVIVIMIVIVVVIVVVIVQRMDTTRATIGSADGGERMTHRGRVKQPADVMLMRR